MNIKIVAPLALLGVVGLANVSSTAVAASWWGQPGADCHAYSGSDTSKFNVYGWTGKTKTGSGSSWLTCAPQTVSTTTYPSAINIYLYHPTSRNTLCYNARTNYFTGATSLVSENISGTGNQQGPVSPLPSKATFDLTSVTCNLASGTVLRDVYYFF